MSGANCLKPDGPICIIEGQHRPDQHMPAGLRLYPAFLTAAVTAGDNSRGIGTVCAEGPAMTFRPDLGPLLIHSAS